MNDRDSLLECAYQQINCEALEQLLGDIVRIDSPSGHERELCEYLVLYLQEQGIDVKYLPIDENRGNVIASLKGNSSGPSLLLTTHLDTFYKDIPEIVKFGLDRKRFDLALDPIHDNGFVIGRGAENPKGYVVAVTGAIIALKRAGIELRGQLLTAFVSGGIITSAQEETLPANLALGVGTEHCLRYGTRSDFAVIAKGGPPVSWESAGCCWIKIAVAGEQYYTGNDKQAYKNPIVEATYVIQELHQLFTESIISGNITAIESGLPHKASVTSAVCHIYLDLTVKLGQDPLEVKRNLDKELSKIVAKYSDITILTDMCLSIPSTVTSPSNWIVESGIRTWEQENGMPFKREAHSHLNDSYILRQWGIPTIQVGMKCNSYPAKPIGLSHGICEVANVVMLTRLLIGIILDTCTRLKEEVGL